MCENTYVACGQCNEPATNLRYISVYDRREQETCSVDEDGDSLHDGDWDDAGETEFIESYYECDCGWRGSDKNDLDLECVPDECECSECVEPEAETAADNHDPNELVLLIRTHDEIAEPWHDHFAIPELKLLFTDRTVSHLPVPRWRIAELFAEHDMPVGIKADLMTEVQPHLRNWMLNYDEREIEHAGNN